MEDVEGGGMGYALTGVLNMPAGETFAIRASGFYRSDEGYIDSIGNNPIPDLQDPVGQHRRRHAGGGELNGDDTYGGRISALFQPSDAFSLNLTALFQEINSDNANRYEADAETLDPLVRRLRGLPLPPGVRRISSTRSTAQRSTGTWDPSRCSR